MVWFLKQERVSAEVWLEVFKIEGYDSSFHQVWITDVEREIRRERGENRMQQQQHGGGKVKRRIGADSRRDQRQTRLSKRETLLEMLMGAVVGGGRGSRRPRKIETGGSNLQQEARGETHFVCTCGPVLNHGKDT